MGSNGAFRPEGDENLRAELTDLPSQLADHLIQVHAIEFAVGVVEDDGAVHLENFAGRGELLAPEGGEFVVRLRPSAMGRGLTCGETNNRSLDVAITIEAERTAEGAGLIVGVSSDGHETKHAKILQVGMQ